MKCYQNVYHVVKEQTYTVTNVMHPGVNYVMISGIDIPKEGNIKLITGNFLLLYFYNYLNTEL